KILPLEMTTSKASFLSSAFAVAYTIGRGFSILIALKLRPEFILCFNFITMTVATFILFLTSTSSETWLWFGMILLGGGVSCTYPTLMTYMEERVEMTNVVTSFVFVSSTVLSALLPV